MRYIGLVLFLFLAIAAPARAGFEEGVAAYHRGDYATAFRELKTLADQGLAKAQFNLGVMFAEGRGVARDFGKAAYWHRLAAKQGYIKAQFNLAIVYRDGVGVPVDRSEAARWFRRAAERGLVEAQFVVGAMYSDGDGVSKDDKAAEAWFRRAAVQGHAGAQHSLGVMFANGGGVPRNLVAAEYWFRKAADQGSAAAQHGLGVIYSEGTNVVARDLVRAYVWYSLAAANGDSEPRRQKSRRKLEAVAAQLSPRDLARARGLAALWSIDRVAVLLTPMPGGEPASPLPPPPPKPVVAGDTVAGQMAVAAVGEEERIAKKPREPGKSPIQAPLAKVPLAEVPLEEIKDASAAPTALVGDAAQGAAEGRAAALLLPAPPGPSESPIPPPSPKPATPRDVVADRLAVAATAETSGVSEASEVAAVEEKLEAASVTAAAETPVAPVVEAPMAEDRVALMSPEKAALLTEDEILTLIVGNSMTGLTRGARWTEYYAPDGTIRGRWRSARYLAKWSVDGGRMCFDYATDGRNFCLMLAVSGDQVFSFRDDGTGGDKASKLLSGNPQNL